MIGSWCKSEQFNSEDINFYKLDVKSGCVACMESTLSIWESFLHFMTLFLGLSGIFVKLWEWVKSDCHVHWNWLKIGIIQCWYWLHLSGFSELHVRSLDMEVKVKCRLQKIIGETVRVMLYWKRIRKNVSCL